MIQVEDKLQRDLAFSNNLLSAFERINLKKPYHLNVIDELHINENAHSRILFKLLSYKNENGYYEILQSFIAHVKNKYHKDEEKINNLNLISINNPDITQEEQRIDLWIKEEGIYALIFENKVCGANDQDAQLYRYIEKTRQCGFKNNSIFIFYLPPTKDGEPSEQTWGNEKENFKNRYFKIPFKEDILPWLEHDVMQNIRHKDFILLTALTQYIDFLKGYFELRNKKQEDKMKEQEIMDNILGIKNQSNKEKVKSLNSRIEELQMTINHLSEYRNNITEIINEEIVANLKKDINHDFPDISYCDVDYGGVSFYLDDKSYKLYIGYDGRWFCQLELDSEESEIECDALNQSGVRDVLNLPYNYKGKYIWKYINHGGISDAYNLLKEVIVKVREFTKE